MTQELDLFQYKGLYSSLYFLPSMRYHYNKPQLYFNRYGITYECNHPVYSKCTLYLSNNKGLSVIQQRYNPEDKSTTWTELDPWLVDDIYTQVGFKDYFEKHAGPPQNHIYPTVTIRQIMWALKMKPIKRQPWETAFDKCPI